MLRDIKKNCPEDTDPRLNLVSLDSDYGRVKTETDEVEAKVKPLLDTSGLKV